MNENTYSVICRTDPYHAERDSRFPRHATRFAVKSGMSHANALRELEQIAHEKLTEHRYLDAANDEDRELIESDFKRYTRPGLYDTNGDDDYLPGDEYLHYDVYTYFVEVIE